MPTIESKKVEIEAEIKRSTENAMQIYDGKTTCWVPKSQAKYIGDGKFRMPEWLAKEKGLI